MIRLIQWIMLANWKALETVETRNGTKVTTMFYREVHNNKIEPWILVWGDFSCILLFQSGIMNLKHL